jgi:predicted ATP-dependent endonuclease of OLD family
MDLESLALLVSTPKILDPIFSTPNVQAFLYKMHHPIINNYIMCEDALSACLNLLVEVHYMGVLNMELYINKVKIQNYRSIRKTEFTLEKQNIIIGKNNIGKSNIINAMNSFKNLKLEDINVDFLEALWVKRQRGEEPSNEDSVCLELTYHWKDLPNDYWYLLSSLATEGDTKIVVTYRVAEAKYSDFKKMDSIKDLSELLEEIVEVGTPNDYSNNNQQIVSNHDVSLYLPTELTSNSVPKFTLFRIDAMRNTTQGRHSNQNEIGQTLGPRIAPLIEKQQETLKRVQSDVDEGMNGDLVELQNELHRFAYPRDEKAPLKAVWTIDEWLQNPGIRLAKVYENLSKFEIPLSLQGLGYQNIYNIIARLNNLFSIVQQNESKSPVLIVIEEPEVFTHPQLQHVFIQQIQAYVNEHSDACNIACQLLIISHSPEVAVSALSLNFDLIIGRSHKENTRFVNWNQLGRLAGAEGDKSRNKLRKLVLSYNAELFFADELLCYEGDGERLILGSLMRQRDRFDKEHALLSEKIALLPVGTHFNGYRAALADLLFDQILLVTDVDFPIKRELLKSADDTSKSAENKKTSYWRFGLGEVESIVTTNSNLSLLTELHSDNIGNKHIDLKPILSSKGQNLTKIFEKFVDDIQFKSSDIQFVSGAICREVGLTIDNQIVAIDEKIASQYARLMIVTQGYLKTINFWPRTLETALVYSAESNFNGYHKIGLIKEKNKWSKILPSLNEVEKNLFASRLHKADFATESLDVISDENFVLPSYLKIGLDWLVRTYDE